MKKNILFFILLLWLILSSLRLIYNLGKIFNEQRNALFQNDFHKRVKLFSCFPIADYLSKHDMEGNLALITDDGFCYFTLRYYMYPVKVFLNPKDLTNSMNAYEYVVSFRKPIGNDLPSMLKKEKIMDSGRIIIYK